MKFKMISPFKAQILIGMNEIIIRMAVAANERTEIEVVAIETAEINDRAVAEVAVIELSTVIDPEIGKDNQIDVKYSNRQEN